MSIIKTSTAYRGAIDHFEPEQALDAAEQSRLRGHLEQIEYAAFAANQAVLAQAPGMVDAGAVQRLAVAAAAARSQWVSTALAIADAGRAPSPEETAALAERRAAFEELREAYEGLRRLIERGYVGYKTAAN